MATAAALDRPPNAVGPICVAVSCLTGMGFFSVSKMFISALSFSVKISGKLSIP